MPKTDDLTSRQDADKPERDEVEAEKRRKLNIPDVKESTLPKPFSEEEIAAEERKPKHKVAVMIGYAGSGYKGMQMWVRLTVDGDCQHSDDPVVIGVRRPSKVTYSMLSSKLVQSPKPTPTIPRNHLSSAAQERTKVSMLLATSYLSSSSLRTLTWWRKLTLIFHHKSESGG